MVSPQISLESGYLFSISQSAQFPHYSGLSACCVTLGLLRSGYWVLQPLIARSLTTLVTTIPPPGRLLARPQFSSLEMGDGPLLVLCRKAIKSCFCRYSHAEWSEAERSIRSVQRSPTCGGGRCPGYTSSAESGQSHPLCCRLSAVSGVFPYFSIFAFLVVLFLSCGWLSYDVSKSEWVQECTVAFAMQEEALSFCYFGNGT